jgi:hypothetical protein
MAAKKMIPPRAVENAFGDDYDEFKLGSFRLQGGQVVMLRMTGGGARKLAERLIEKAAELDRLGTASAPNAKPRATTSQGA